MLEWSSLPKAVLWPVDPLGSRFGYVLTLSDGEPSLNKLFHALAASEPGLAFPYTPS